MTNAELIAKLREFPADLPVEFYVHDDDSNSDSTMATVTLDKDWPFENACGSLWVTFETKNDVHFTVGAKNA